MTNFKHKKIFENNDFGIININDTDLGYIILAIIKNKNFNQYNKIVEELNKLKEKDKYNYNEIIVDNLLFKDENLRYDIIYFIEDDTEENKIIYHNIVMGIDMSKYTKYKNEYTHILKETTKFYLNSISQLNTDN